MTLISDRLAVQCGAYSLVAWHHREEWRLVLLLVGEGECSHGPA